MLTINSKREKTKAETFSGNETFADMKSVSILRGNWENFCYGREDTGVFFKGSIKCYKVT